MVVLYSILGHHIPPFLDACPQNLRYLYGQQYLFFSMFVKGVEHIH